MKLEKVSQSYSVLLNLKKYNDLKLIVIGPGNKNIYNKSQISMIYYF